MTLRKEMLVAGQKPLEFSRNSFSESSPIHKDNPKRRRRSNPSSAHAQTRSGQRVSRACDRCRLKKAKCTGGTICARCQEDSAVCVTSLHRCRQRDLVRPEYLCLVEAQRDQLIKAVTVILNEENLAVSSRMRTLLTEMGISVDTFEQSEPSETSVVTVDEPDDSEPQSPPRDWDEIFSDLDIDFTMTVQQLSEMDSSVDSMSPPLILPYVDLSYDTECQDWSMLY